jgi:hypothetical protein
MPDPIAYLSSPFGTGTNGLETGDVEIATVADAESAVWHPHATDAHFVCYVLRSLGQMPRMNKSALPFVRLVGDDVVLPWVAVDIDNPAHAKWAQGEAFGFAHALNQAAQSGHPDAWTLTRYWGFWTSRGGARLLYRLDVPVSPEEWEPIAAGLVETLNRLFAAVGLRQRADIACTQWNRLFRLPNTVRDGFRTADDHYYLSDCQPGESLPAASLPRGVPQSTSYASGHGAPIPVRRIPDALPDELEAAALIERQDPQTGRMRLTSWASDAKQSLRGREYYSALFEHAPLADIGSRDTTLYKAVSSVVSLLYGHFGTTPVHVYGLFLNVVKGLAPDAGTPNWFVSLWHKVRHAWALEEARGQAEQIRKAEIETAKLSTLGKMTMGMAKWFPHPDLTVNPASGLPTAQALPVVTRHAIAMLNNGREFYVMAPDGRYWPMVLAAGALIPAIRRLLGEDVIPTQHIGKDGTARDLTPVELVNHFGTIVSEVIYEPGEVEGGVLRWPDTDRAKLVITPFSRNPELTPAYDPLVDHWLLLMFGAEQKLRVERWLAWALAFEEGPIACLSVVGPSGCGKSMLAAGLRETLRTPASCSFDEIAGDWQYGILRSPFVFADEGVGSPGLMRSHPSDVFRRMIGRSDVTANRKNLAPVSVSIDARLLMTANNLKLIRSLTANRDLTPEDREAIMVRLLHVEARQEAATWLNSQGGRRFTRGWISDGRNSDYVLARHLLWLHSRRHAYGADARLLVEGDISGPVMAELRMHGGTQDRVLEAVVALAGRCVVSKLDCGARILDGCIYVLPQAVHKFVREDLSLNGVRILDVKEALTSIVAAGSRSEGGVGIKLPNDRRDWYRVDVDFLARVADQYGWKIDHVLAEVERSASRGSEPLPLSFAEQTAKMVSPVAIPPSVSQTGFSLKGLKPR